MRYLIVFLTIISTINLFSEDYKLWERQFSVEGGLRNAEFAGANDEFIVAYDKRHIYRFVTGTSEMIDSLYSESFVLGTAVSKDGLKYYISISDNPLYIYDVNTMKVIDTIPAPSLSESATDKTTFGFQDLNLSKDGRYLTCRYTEINLDNNLHCEFVIYDLENKRVIAREGDESRGYQSMFYNPTFTPDAETLLVIVDRPSTDFNEEERQVWFYDISEQKFITIGQKDQFKNKVQTNSGNNSNFIFIGNKEVYIYNSSLPDLSSFNVLNLNNGDVSEYFNFRNQEKNFSPRYYRQIENSKGLLTIFNNNKKETYLTVFDIFEKDTLALEKVVQLGANIYINKNNTKFISFNAYSLWVNDLSKYLELTNVINESVISTINLSPNPSNSRSYTLRMNLLSNINASINLYNTVGQKVLTIKENTFLHIGENIVDFNIPLELPFGQYFLRIESERGSQDVTIQL